MQVRQEIEGTEFWMWFVILFVMGLVFFIIILIRLFYKNILKKEQRLNENKLEYQKELLKTTILTQEKERNRIAQDIHDGLVSQLNVIRLSKKDDEKAINTKLKECIKTVRLISHDLMPPFIEETSLQELLHKVINGLGSDSTIKTHKVVLSKDEIDANTKLQLLRIVQEVTTNILKHAEANQIIFLLRITKEYIALKIEDNGVGFEDSNSKGLGFKNITARTQLLNGSYKFKSIPNIRTCFLLKMPVNKT
ncbi:sensor histidine kinase [Kordia sp.]|uniref:sensor histidine kinase n=1 Tax=Kordia sp. TaxID=1965332 RepID=UPI003D2D73D1